MIYSFGFTVNLLILFDFEKNKIETLSTEHKYSMVDYFRTQIYILFLYTTQTTNAHFNRLQPVTNSKQTPIEWDSQLKLYRPIICTCKNHTIHSTFAKKKNKNWQNFFIFESKNEPTKYERIILFVMSHIMFTQNYGSDYDLIGKCKHANFQQAVHEIAYVVKIQAKWLWLVCGARLFFVVVILRKSRSDTIYQISYDNMIEINERSRPVLYFQQIFILCDCLWTFHIYTSMLVVVCMKLLKLMFCLFHFSIFLTFISNMNTRYLNDLQYKYIYACGKLTFVLSIAMCLTYTLKRHNTPQFNHMNKIIDHCI